MKRRWKWPLILLILVGVAGGGYSWLHGYWAAHNGERFRTATVEAGEITSVVNSTGTVQPVLSVQVGSFVSGPIIESFADFNTRVKKDELMARIDPRIYEANVARDNATLAHANAEVARVEALLHQATNDFHRAERLQATERDYISETEMDQFRFQEMSLAAQLEVAKAQVKQADAALVLSRANLGYTEILSPVDGIVVDRKVDPGQTIAAQFQTPVLFIVAPDMEKRMFIYASVDEADIGLIRAAQERGEPVRFTVDAYPDDLFQGRIYQVRMNSTTQQNVVTYTVVVETANAELKLMPGMTASLSFQIEHKDGIVKVPNSALRYYPKFDDVRPEDRALLEGVAPPEPQDETQPDTTDSRRSAAERFEAARKRNLRHVWVVDGPKLRAIEVISGLSDNQFTELVSGPLQQGQKLVIGVRTTLTP